jgi:hypothetical protein
MRLAMLFAATACIGLVAGADGVARKAVSSPEIDRLTATETSMTGGPATPGFEADIYRHGATYRVDTGTTALDCQVACGEDGLCQAWSFVEAYGSAGARCELKQGGGKPEENLLATSGISPRLDAGFWGETTVEVEAPADDLAGESAEPPAAN